MPALLLHALILKRQSEAFSSYQKADLSGWRAWARPGVVMNITHTPTQEGEREEKAEREHGRRGFDLKWQMLMERANASANFPFFFMRTYSLKICPAEKSECLLVYVGGTRTQQQSDAYTPLSYSISGSFLPLFYSYFTHFICTGMTGCFNVSMRYTQK